MFERFKIKLKTMGRLVYFSITIILSALLFFACEPPRSYPETPEIKFKSLRIQDAIDTLDNQIKLIKLTLSVIDGDGDIGILGDNNFVYPGFEDMDNRDLYITMFEKIDGELVEVETAEPNNFGMPYLEPEGQDKTLEADIEVSMSIPIQFYTYDTILYSFFLYDRAKHISNVAETPEIPADSLGLIE